MSVLLDCRWLGYGGAGRVTEMLLSELLLMRPPGDWHLWGEAGRLRPFVFPGASIAPWSGRPTRWFVQADLMRVPDNDIAIYLHQIRPLRPGRAITFVLDTIPIRFGGWRALRGAKRLFYLVACRLSQKVITISDWSRDSIVRDLGVPPSKIVITSLAVDPSRVKRLRAMRATSPRENQILFVGRFAAHKNLARLCRAFQRTAFHRSGGRLVLVGGSPEEVANLSSFVARERMHGIDVRGPLAESELDRLMATCRALVQPSLEEGFGLPAVEAAAIGVQVAVTRTGGAGEIPATFATFMDGRDDDSMASAIDQAIARPDPDVAWLPRSTLAADVLASIENVMSQ